MAKFWKIVVVIALILAAMMLITFLVPDINKFASGLAAKNKLPIWLVGLASPILYALAKFKDMLGSIMGDSNTEKDIRGKNEEIKAKLADLEKSVQSLDTWRRDEIDRRMKQVDSLNTTVNSMEGREKVLDQSIGGLMQRREALKNAIREDPGTIE